MSALLIAGLALVAVITASVLILRYLAEELEIATADNTHLRERVRHLEVQHRLARGVSITERARRLELEREIERTTEVLDGFADRLEDAAAGIDGAA